ncbi:type I polyketide synthase [Kitasatospora sp. NPDC094028]
MTPQDGQQTSTSTLKRAYVTIERLQRRIEAYERAASEPIAVVGLGCRFPGGVVDADSYWRILTEGIDAVSEIPADRWDVDDFYSAEPRRPGRMSTRWGGFLDRIDRFDHEFFGISRREALVMDPQQRLTLEVVWEALENAGQAPAELAGSSTGVFLGVCSNDFATEYLTGPAAATAYASTGSAHSIVTGRVSYVLDLRGPSVATDTACSSSLVAVDQACRSLRSGDCDLAISGGVNAIVSPLPSISFSQFPGMVAPDGRCKTFDASANGYVRGEGCGIVVLKRLSDAERDGDQVLAVIRGGAVNQDGRSSGITAPNGAAQRDVLRRALRTAGVAAEEVSYVEAHGTGTTLGDPIEVEALAEVYGRPQGAPVYLGSSKTNLGHLEAASGVAGLIKVVLSLSRGAIPGNVHFTRLNPHISFDGTTFAVPTGLTPWPAPEGRRAAGVSSFGFSGTNAHLIVAQAPARTAPEADTVRPASVLALSARSGTALAALADRYRERLTTDAATPPADLCYSANTGRSHFRHRLAVTGATRHELAEALGDFAAGRAGERLAHGQAGGGEAVFLFTGQGPQRPGMARALYETQPTFRRVLDTCDELLRPVLERPLLSVIHPEDPGSGTVDENTYSQPALFAVEYALAQLWRSWGVEPAAVLGHSFGEYVAACVAGMMSLEDGLRLVAERGRLMQALAANGSMAVVFAPEMDVAMAVADHPDTVSIAAVNGPANVAISGVRADVEAICAGFARYGVESRQLRITTASHSPLIEPVIGALRAAVEKVAFSAPRIPLVANLTGELWPWERVPDADYWAEHARQPVRFAAGISTLRALGHDTFLEMGPAPTLLGLVEDCLPDGHDALLLPSLRRGQDDWEVLLSSLGRLYARGADIDWRGFDRDYTRAKVTVPGYAFDPTSLGQEPVGRRRDGYRASTVTDEQDGAGPDEDLLYRLDWQPAEAAAPRAAAVDGPAPTWLVLADGTGVGDALAAAVEEQGARCVRVVPASDYRYDREQGTAEVRTGTAADLGRLLAELAPGEEELRVVHLWSLDEAGGEPASADRLLAGQERSCMSAVRAVQALAEARSTRSTRLWLVTRGAAGPDTQASALGQSTLWGLGRSLQQEHAGLWGGLVDLDPQAEPKALAHRLLAELAGGDGEDQIALRGEVRHVARLTRAPLAAPTARGFGWRTDASYLVTGGLSGVGLALARAMVLDGARHLVLVGRTPLPPRHAWAARTGDSPVAQRVAAVRELESLGASVTVAPCDVSDEDAVRELLARHDAEGRPPIRGVLHAAGIGAVTPLRELQLDDLEAQFKPKAAGAWILDRLLADRPLDFFVLCSSASSLLSSPFVAGYAAANAFLDSLAQRRRAQGRPALSINWGIWAQTGMALRGPEASGGLGGGMGTLRPEQAARIFLTLLRQETAQVAVLPTDWATWGHRYQQASGSALLSELTQQPDRPASARAAAARTAAVRASALPTRDELLALAPAERVAALTAQLSLSATATLRAQGDGVVADRPLIDLGLDSLMAVELRNEIEGRLGTSLPISVFLEGATVRALAQRIVDQLADGDGETAAAAAPIQRVRRRGDVAADLLAQITGGQEQ